MADRLELEARFNDHASAGVKRLGKTLEAVRPSNGMQAAGKWMSDFRGAAEKAHVAVRPLTTTLTALGVGGLAASMSLGEIVKQMKSLSDGTLDLRELSRQTNISMSDLQRLQFVATKFRIDPAAVNGVLSEFSDKMLDLRKHTGDFYTYLLRQNADVARKIAADSPIDALKDTLDYMSRIKDPALQRRYAESMNLGQFVPMLGKGPDGLKATFAEAGREVTPVTEALIAASERMNDSTNRMNQSWTNLKNDIGPSFLDPMSKMIDHLDEVLKSANASPGDAAAVAGVGVLSAAAIYAQRRIMRGSRIAGGTGMSRASGEMAGAASEQKLATTTFAEAVAEFRLGVREMAGKGGAPGGGAGGAPGEGAKPNGASPGYGSLLTSAALAALNIFDLARNAPEQLEKAKTDNAPMDAQVGREADWGDRLRKFFRGSPSDMHPDDDRLSRARPDDLKREVQEGSKAGIIAGLRELAQQQELEGGGGPTANAGGGRMLGRGAANMRYGRQGGGAGAGAYKGTPVPDAPYNGKNIEGLSPEASKKYAAILGNRESGNRYGTTNPYGYAGRWQFGASALAENGYVQPGTTNAGLRNPGSWTGKGGVGSIGDWLANKGGVQDQALGEYTNRHYAQLKAAGVIRNGMSPSEIAGWLAAAHLKGVGGAIALSRGHDNVDANGTSASSYRRMMQGVGAAPATPAAPGAGTPAPASASVTDAEVFAARQRLIAGGHDPKDVALRDRYLKEQNTPKGHAAGGAIRGAGSSRSDSIPAWLSNGEFVVNARASGQWLPFLHAINAGRTYADGGEVAAGAGRRRSWLDFFQRARGAGGMGAARHVALGATAMMMGESGRNLDPKVFNPNDVDGPSGGSAQWHDVVKGPWAGRLHRFSDLLNFANGQHRVWTDLETQQKFFRKEATGSMAFAWDPMRKSTTALGALRQGINKFENPADHLGELRRRLPNIVRLAREGGGRGGETRVAHDIDPVEVNIRHHPHTGQPIVSARAGKGVKLGIRTAPMMRPT